MKSWMTVLAAVAVGASATLAGAQTLYKLIDKNGKVTYSESAPKDFDGQVIRIDIDSKANTATLPKLAPRAAEPATNPGTRSAGNADSAREKLEAARKALAQALENPAEGEVQWIANKGGGTRQVQSEDFKSKLAKLEQDVKAAEEELRRAEGR